METAITTKNLSKVFEDKPGEKFVVFKDITLEIRAGEFFVILGLSGSGKSTLLRIMSGLEKSYEGSALLGKNFSSRDVSFVFQQFALFPWLTVFQNVEVGLLALDVSLRERHERVMKELRQFGLEKFSHTYPKELSGGMRQRVGIARALVGEQKIIFMDEPFSEVDSFTAEELRQDLLHIWHERKPTIVMVTHLIPEALELADRIAVLTPRPGRIEKIVTNTLPRPRDKRSPDFYRLEDELYRLIKP